MEYLPVSREEIEKYASYNEKKKTYDWMRLGCFNYAPNFLELLSRKLQRLNIIPMEQLLLQWMRFVKWCYAMRR